MSIPSAKAFHFVIDGSQQNYDAYIDMVQIDGGVPYMDCRYRPVSNPAAKWSWLIGPNLFNVSDTVETDKTFNDALDKVNAEIKKVFGSTAGDIPLKGLERIQWLIQYGLSETANVISRV